MKVYKYRSRRGTKDSEGRDVFEQDGSVRPVRSFEYDVINGKLVRGKS